jgi:hypothetical protein
VCVCVYVCVCGLVRSLYIPRGLVAFDSHHTSIANVRSGSCVSSAFLPCSRNRRHPSPMLACFSVIPSLSTPPLSLYSLSLSLLYAM